MAINLKDYILIKKCEGNGVNKIYIVQHKETSAKYVLKIVKIHN